MSTNDPKILYVDDDIDDREFFREAMKEVNASAELVSAKNGLEALDYLKTTPHADNKLPCVIVLDINMPFLDGKQTFERLREDLRLKNIPVVVLTSSHRPGDQQYFHSRGVELIHKPTSAVYLENIVRKVLAKCR